MTEWNPKIPIQGIFCFSWFNVHVDWNTRNCRKMVFNSCVKSNLCIFRTLDLSFNLIKTIENLGCLTKVKKLFLVSNKISKIEGLQNLSQLEMIELGANKIRVSIKIQMNYVPLFTVTRLLIFVFVLLAEGSRGIWRTHTCTQFICWKEQDHKTRGGYPIASL